MAAIDSYIERRKKQHQQDQKKQQSQYDAYRQLGLDSVIGSPEQANRQQWLDEQENKRQMAALEQSVLTQTGGVVPNLTGGIGGINAPLVMSKGPKQTVSTPLDTYRRELDSVGSGLTSMTMTGPSTALAYTPVTSAESNRAIQVFQPIDDFYRNYMGRNIVGDGDKQLQSVLDQLKLLSQTGTTAERELARDYEALFQVGRNKNAGDKIAGTVATFTSGIGAGLATYVPELTGGLSAAIGDAATRGGYSSGFKALDQYFALHPDTLSSVQSGKPVWTESIKAETGVSDQVLRSYLQSTSAEATQRDQLASIQGTYGLSDKWAEGVYSQGVQLGRQIPGLAMSTGAAGSGDGGLLGTIMSGGTLGTAAKTALKGNLATYLIGTISAAGSYAKNIREHNYSVANYANALAQGFIEYFTEGLFGFSDMPSFERALTNPVGGSASRIFKALIAYLESGLEEGAEEVANVPLSAVVDWLTGYSTGNTDRFLADPRIYTEEVTGAKALFDVGGIFDVREMWKSGVDGAIGGLLMGSAATVIAAAQSVAEGADIREAVQAINREAYKVLPEQYRPQPLMPNTVRREDIIPYRNQVLDAIRKYRDNVVILQRNGQNIDVTGIDITTTQNTSQGNTEAVQPMPVLNLVPTEAGASVESVTRNTIEDAMFQYGDQLSKEAKLIAAEAWKNYRDLHPNTRVTAQQFVNEFTQAYTYGMGGATLDTAKAGYSGELLTDATLEAAYKAGQAAANGTTTAPETTPAAETAETEAPDTSVVEEFAQNFQNPERVMEIYRQNPGADTVEFTEGFTQAYDRGQSGLSESYLRDISGLTDAQQRAAFQMGREDANVSADTRAADIAKRQKSGNLRYTEGTVKGVGVTIADLKKTFNDTQNVIYRALTKYAQATGVNIVLYRSQPDANGDYTAANGRFEWKDDTIYIDLNAGLDNIKNANDLTQYVGLRTFAHEFTHFIEKWNPKGYNEFRQFVFRAMEQNGRNVNDMIESVMSQDDNLTYEKASREVVAEGMSDVLTDSDLVRQLSEEQPNVFRRLLARLRDFVARLKQYYKGLKQSNAETKALMQAGKYMDGIVDMWDQIAREAVHSYQGAVSQVYIDQPAKPDNLPKYRPRPAVQQQAEQMETQQEQTEPVTEAVSETVPVAEEVQEKPTKGSANNFLTGDIFSSNAVQTVQESSTASEIVKKMPTAPEVQEQPVQEAPATKPQTVTESREDATNGTTETEAPTVVAGGETNADRNGNRTVRVPVPVQEGDVQRNAEGREPAPIPAKRGRKTGRNAEQSDTADRTSGGTGNDESGVQPGLGEHDVTPETSEEQKKQAEELHEETVQQTEQQSTEAAGGNNYQIGDSLDLPKGEKARYKANVEAIRLVKQLEAEGRNATAEEQAVLARYVGWGGIPNAFDERKPDWSQEYAELKELLTEEEYNAAKGSTLNAHYTSIPVIRAMYRGLDKLGFNGGRMLEPSSGVGNFVGAMPADMSAKVKSWTMVELDNITGLIAKYLYPQNDVRIDGFEKAIIPDNYMDVAISNVPFGNYPVVDRAYPKKITSAIHNYFFAKSLDKVRPGGIVMFITSSFTMNSADQTVRKYIAKKADLLGAIRLPNTAFSGNAGTSVVTDILVLKKRQDGIEYSGVPFIEAPYDYKTGYQNEYFKAHPDMVLGEEVTSRGMYSRNEYTVNPYTDRGSLESQIDKAFKNIDGQIDYPVKPTPEQSTRRAQRAERGTKEGCFVQKDGKLYQNTNGELNEVQTDEKTEKRIKGMLTIRDFARALLNAQQRGEDAKTIKTLRTNLNKAYDTFVKVNGYLNSPANKKAFSDDPDRYSLYALENWDSEKKTATKADIFTTDTVKPVETITHADTVKDAVAICRNTIGNIDVQVISNLTGKSQQDVTRELIESELAYKDRDGHLEPAETYLSGNVRAKLRDAQGLVGIDKDYQHNVDALKRIVPADISHEQIYVQPGTPWIPTSVYSDFAADILGGNNHRSWGVPDVTVNRSNQTGTFTIDLGNKRLKQNYHNTQEWGTPKRSFLNLLEAVMNSRSVTVTYRDSEGHTYVDQVATDAANEMVEKITKRFQEWLWEDEKRAKDLEYLYNETYNNLVTPKYDGSTLTVNGLRAGWSLRPHQADAVQRIVTSGGNTLLAHRVGAGKTLEMAAAAMKLKELGIVNKPMFAVPKSLVAQWGKEFTSYFPAAKLLVAEQSDFTPANRKTFANRIATGNYDAIIVSYEQFEKIPISNSFATNLYQEQINEIIMAINEAKEESGKNSMSVKDMEKKRKQLEAKIQKLADSAKDTDNIEFEQLGIDSIFIDEAHNFKNLFYTTSMNNVAGLGNKDGSQRAFDLYTKVRYLQQLNGGRGVVFATATPVMNSMSEMYIMQKYLQSDLLNQLGLSTFDAWAKQFGEIVNGVEIKPSGQGYRVKQSFSRFKNMNELQLMFRNFSDVLTTIPGLKIPKMKGGAVKVVECEAGEFQKNYMKELEKRADNVKNVDPSEDNMLKITSDGRKISYTQRMIDPSLPYEENGKIYKAAENILAEYKGSMDIKGTQIVFIDMATPKGKTNNAKASADADSEMDTESAQLYDDLKRRLVKLGIPAKEIAFIHDADTDAKKSKLFDDVNAGRVRVLIGSTGKMGVGMNAQKRAVAIHHLDAPWRPGDVEQRDGRVYRQGNINEEVSKYVYVTKGSFDARLWDIIDRKSNFIDQIMNGENVGREVEDTGEVTLSAAEVKALASGSPLILEQVQLQTDIKKLENLYMAWRSSVANAQKHLQEAIQAKAQAENRASNAKADSQHRTADSMDDTFSITIGNKTFTDKKDAGKALLVQSIAKAKPEGYTKIGAFAGFDVLVMQTPEGIIGLLKADGAYRFNVYPDNTTLMITNMQKVLNSLDALAMSQEELARQKAQEITAQEKLLNSPFERQDELDQKRKRYNEVMDILNPKEEQKLSSDDDDTVQYSRRRTDSDEEDAIQNDFNADYVLYEHRVLLSESTLEKWMKEYAASNPKYAQAYIAYMSPSQFLSMTTSNISSQTRIENDSVGLTPEDAAEYTKDQPIQLIIDTKTGKVEGHEGRHRMAAFKAEGIFDVPVLLFDSSNKYDKEPMSTLKLTGQDFNDNENHKQTVVKDLIPFSRGNIQQITDRFSVQTGQERISEKYGISRMVQFSTRRPTISDREVLRLAANELDVDGLTDGEKDALRIFNERLERLEDAQEKRNELGQQYREENFTKGGSKAASAKILSDMKIWDTKIKALETSVLSIENKDVLKAVLQKARRVVEREQARIGEEKLKAYRARRNESVAVQKYREQVRTLADTFRKWLMHPSNKNVVQHVPAELQKTVVDFLDSINFLSKRALNTSGLDTTKADRKYLRDMKSLRDAIQHNVESQGLYSGYNDLPEGFIEEFQEMIENTQDYIDSNDGVFVVNQMSSEELRRLYETLKTLRKFITNINKFHNNAMFEHAYEAGGNTIGELTPLHTSTRSGKAYNFIRFNYMRPSLAFEHFGKGGMSIEHEFREGQATMAFLAQEVIDFAKETFKPRETKEWHDAVHTFTLENGEEIRMTETQIMSLYMLNKRNQALSHIYGDGIRAANFKEGRKVNLDVKHKVTKNDVANIIGTLSDRQIEVADALQNYMSTDLSEMGNYVSMARFDVEQFTEKNYFPINVDGRYLPATADEMPGNAELYALLNMGFSKETKPNASNALILYDVFDVFANHAASMIQYRSFALPILDALKWFNYSDNRTSVREQLSRAFGAPEEKRAGSGSKGYAESFVLNLLRAYNGTAPQGGYYEEMGRAGLHRFNRAAVAYNLRVVVQQPLAITRAATLLPTTKLLKGLGMSAVQLRKLAEEMEAHSGIALMKRFGFYDTNISIGLNELIKQERTFGEKVTDFGMKGAERADRFTWAAMWYAAKDTVNRADYETEQDYWDAVTGKFEDVIYKTQVVDTVLTKSEFLRDNSFVARMFGSFMSEPSATVSLVADAYYKFTDDLQRGMSKAEAWRNNSRNIYRTMAVYAIGQGLLALIQSIIDAYRDNDDYQPPLDKYWEALKRNLVEELLPMGKLPVISEGWDSLKWVLDKFGLLDKIKLNLYGNKLSDGWAQYAQYLYRAVEIAADKMNGKPYKHWGWIYNLIRGGAGMTGFPVGTATREVVDLWNFSVGSIYPNYKIRTYDPGEDKRIKYAYQDGYLTKEEAVELLESLAGLSAEEAAEMMQDWRRKEIRDELTFDNGEETVQALVDEAGMSERDAYFDVQKRQYEATTGLTYSKYNDVYDAILGDFDEGYRLAMKKLTDHGYEQKDVESAVRSILRHLYTGQDLTAAESDIAGDESITAAEAVRLLVKYGGLEEGEAQFRIDEWEAEAETGDKSSWNQYDEFFTAVETGRNLKQTVQKYLDRGVKGSTLTSQITKQFKPVYLELYEQGKASSLIGYLINAYVLCDTSDATTKEKEDKAKKKINNWVKELEEETTAQDKLDRIFGRGA